jgi:hypothetical protein
MSRLPPSAGLTRCNMVRAPPGGVPLKSPYVRYLENTMPRRGRTLFAIAQAAESSGEACSAYSRRMTLSNEL